MPIIDISDTTQGANGSTRKITKANLTTDLAPKASPTFTGTVTVPVGLTGVLRADTGVMSVDTDVTDIVSAASTTAAGKVEIAIGSEVDTGTDDVRAISPKAIADSAVTTASKTQTLTNKRITPRILSAASYTTDTGTSLNCDNLDQFIVTAQAGALKLNNPTGTPTDGQKLIVAITGTAARALTYDTQFEASTVALPTTTVTTARLNMGFIWRADTSKWVIIASA